MPVSSKSASAPGTERLQVGDWVVEPALNQLSAVGKTVKLEPKAMAVLCHLASRPGQVASREALLSAVWPGVVVSDDALTQVIIKLRKALGDVPDKPAYIQTISKGGYRLIAAVAWLPEVPSPVQPDADSSHAERRWRVPWIVGAGLATLLLAAAGAWWIQGRPAAGVAPGQFPIVSVDAARTDQPTVAIRPFEALSNDPQEVLLARGVTADLVTDLSKVFGLSVIGAASVAGQTSGAIAGDVPPPPRYLVTGSIQRINESLRLQVHLTDTGTGKQLWSQRFDRTLSSLFAIQEELGPKILQMLPAKVSEAELRRVAQRHTRNLEAYEYFQRGQPALLARQKEENQNAREMFQRAIALDATFARAYAGLALTYAADYRNQWVVDGRVALDRAFELARTAYQMNPDIPETYWVLAFVHMERRQHEQALQFLATAVRLHPSYADGYALMAGINTYIGRPAESVRLLRIAMRLDPQAGSLYFLNLGRAYLFLGDLEQARVNLKHALSRNLENLEAHIYMAALHVAAGDNAAAALEADEIRALQPGFSVGRWLETYPMTDIAQKTKLVQALGEIGL